MIVHNKTLFTALVGDKQQPRSTSRAMNDITSPSSPTYSVSSQVSERFHGKLYFPEMKIRKHRVGGSSYTNHQGPAPPLTKCTHQRPHQFRPTRRLVRGVCKTGRAYNPAVQSAPINSVHIDPGYISKEIDNVHHLRRRHQQRKLVLKRKGAIENNKYMARVKQITEKHTRNLKQLGAMVVNQELEINLGKVLKANQRAQVKQKLQLEQNLKTCGLIDQREKCDIQTLRNNARIAINRENRKVQLNLESEVRTQVIKQKLEKLVEDRTREVERKLKAEEKRLRNIERERSRLRRLYHEEKRRILVELSEAEFSKPSPGKETLGQSIQQIEKVWDESCALATTAVQKPGVVSSDCWIPVDAFRHAPNAAEKRQPVNRPSDSSLARQHHPTMGSTKQAECYPKVTRVHIENDELPLSSMNKRSIGTWKGSGATNASSIADVNLQHSESKESGQPDKRSSTWKTTKPEEYLEPKRMVPLRNYSLNRCTTPPKSKESSLNSKEVGSGRNNESLQNDNEWIYIDKKGELQGPFSQERMRSWYKSGFILPSLVAQYRPADYLHFSAMLSLEEHFVGIDRGDWFLY